MKLLHISWLGGEVYNNDAPFSAFPTEQLLPPQLSPQKSVPKVARATGIDRKPKIFQRLATKPTQSRRLVYIKTPTNRK